MFKTFWFNSIPLFLFLCGYNFAYTEYIIYKQSNDKTIETVSDKEHKEAYEIILKYQFPTTLCYQDQIKLNKEEKELYESSEEKFIQSKLPKNIKIKFIPTIIYELLFYKFYLIEALNSTIPKYDDLPDNDFIGKLISLNKKNEKISDSLIIQERNEFRKIYAKYGFSLGTQFIVTAYEFYTAKYKLVENLENWDSKHWQAMREFNNDDYIIELHYKVNNKIIDYLKSISSFNDEDLTAIVSKLINEINNTLKKLENKHYAQIFDRVLHLKLIGETTINFFKSIAMAEYNAHKLGNFLIFRGTNGHYSDYSNYSNASKIDLIDSSQHFLFGDKRLSYGNSFLSGFLRDITACPFYYFGNRNIGYVLPINKIDYLDKKECFEFFFIPPLTPLQTISLWGEYFHVSSKTKLPNCTGEHLNNCCLQTNSTKSGEEFEKSFQKYLNDNTIFLINKPDIKLRSKL